MISALQRLNRFCARFNPNFMFSLAIGISLSGLITNALEHERWAWVTFFIAMSIVTVIRRFQDQGASAEQARMEAKQTREALATIIQIQKSGKPVTQAQLNEIERMVSK